MDGKNYELNNFPQSEDVWKCCRAASYKRYSELVRHIEKDHLPISYNILPNNKGTLYKYICDICDNRFFEYNIAISHFIKKHIKYSIRCFQCLTDHSILEEFKHHVYSCNKICFKRLHSPIQWSFSAQKERDSD